MCKGAFYYGVYHYFYMISFLILVFFHFVSNMRWYLEKEQNSMSDEKSLNMFVYFSLSRKTAHIQEQDSTYSL